MKVSGTFYILIAAARKVQPASSGQKASLAHGQASSVFAKCWERGWTAWELRIVFFFFFFP